MSGRLPRVSVLLCVRNGEPFVEPAIRSILEQDWEDFELIAVDDCSTDGTPDLLAELRDRRVRRLRGEGTTLAAALNLAANSARAELLARMDADDLALPSRLGRQVRFLDEDPDCVAAGSWAQMIDQDSQPLRPFHPPLSGDALRRGLLYGSNPMAHPSVMMRAAAFRGVGGYRCAFRRAQDLDLWLRLLRVGSLRVIPEELILLRQHDTRASAGDGVYWQQVWGSTARAAFWIETKDGGGRRLTDRQLVEVSRTFEQWVRRFGLSPRSPEAGGRAATGAGADAGQIAARPSGVFGRLAGLTWHGRPAAFVVANLVLPFVARWIGWEWHG
ncbi:MAG: glycosyltransferase family 2 protein [Deltaproteobacteria bacterium]|nr:glycosyltransferase family 2 protein [Deltaproteobacteria bacterium]